MSVCNQYRGRADEWYAWCDLGADGVKDGNGEVKNCETSMHAHDDAVGVEHILIRACLFMI